MRFSAILNQLASPAEHIRWEACLAKHARDYDRAAQVVREGSEPRYLHVVLSGWVQIYRQLEDGRRQIAAFVLPGEICDLDIFTVGRTDYAVSAVRQLTVAEIRRETLSALLDDCPRIAAALVWAELLAAKRRSEWLTTLGQRNAAERVAHLMCELFFRQQRPMPGGGGICEFPVTQAQIADATGLTQVHVNRTVQDLRRSIGVEVRDRRLHVPDFKRLAGLAHFSPGYLHQDEAQVSARALSLLAHGTPPAFAAGRPATSFGEKRDGIKWSAPL